MAIQGTRTTCTSPRRFRKFWPQVDLLIKLLDRAHSAIQKNPAIAETAWLEAVQSSAEQDRSADRSDRPCRSIWKQSRGVIKPFATTRNSPGASKLWLKSAPQDAAGERKPAKKTSTRIDRCIPTWLKSDHPSIPWLARWWPRPLMERR